jgi:iron complex transport system permease protein
MTRRQIWLLRWLMLLFVLALCCAAGIGAYTIKPWHIPSILWTRGEGFEILWSIRFPRVFLACLVGGILAIAGVSLQGLFRNPLADPGLLGIHAGAGLGAASWIVFFGQGWFGLWGISLAAFAGAWFVTWGAWQIAQRDGRLLITTLLLTGVAMNSFAGAGIGLMTFLADEQQLRSLTFWMLGGLGGGTWSLIAITACFGGIGLFFQLRLSRPLDLMSFGESDAFHMGVDTEALKRQIVFGTTLSVAAAVAAAGGIGFIGLVIPHLMRLLGGASHRFLMLSSLLSGAILLMLADLAARMIVAPAELPVGIITSLLGAPFFLWLLLRNKREAAHA